MPFGKALRQLLHLVLDALLQVERVGARHLVDGEHDGRVVAEEGRRRVLQRAELDAGDIAQPHQRRRLPAFGAHDDLAELGRIAQPADAR